MGQNEGFGAGFGVQVGQVAAQQVEGGGDGFGAAEGGLQPHGALVEGLVVGVQGQGTVRLRAGERVRAGHEPLPAATRACDSATVNEAVACVVRAGSVPACPAPAHEIAHVTLAVTANAPPGCPAEEWV